MKQFSALSKYFNKPLWSGNPALKIVANTKLFNGTYVPETPRGVVVIWFFLSNFLLIS